MDTYQFSRGETEVEKHVNKYRVYRLREKSTFVCRVCHPCLKSSVLMVLGPQEFEFMDMQPNWPEVTDRNQSHRGGWYEHPIIQTAIDTALFRDSNDLGVKFALWFNPIPLEMITLIVTIVSKCC
jgi:hypothetical protein